MIIIGSFSNLLRIEDLMLAQAIKLRQATEATKQHARELSCQPTATCQHAIDTQNEIEQEHLPDSNHFFVGTVDEQPGKVNFSTTSLDNKIPNEQEWFVSIDSNSTFINYKLDTGAQAKTSTRTN